MNPVLGWALAAVMVGLSWWAYGWQGVVMAVSVVVFWLLLQFNRAMRVMKNAAGAPVGHIDSAVMLNAKLKADMTMLQLVMLTKSLGKKVGDSPERWAWSDPGGSRVTVEFRGGKLESWTLGRGDGPA